MQWGADNAPVLVGSEHNEESTRIQIGGGKLPLSEIAGGVGEIPTVQVAGARAAVGNFDPILIRAVFIGQSPAVGSHEFGDGNVFGGGSSFGPEQAAEEECELHFHKSQRPD